MSNHLVMVPIKINGLHCSQSQSLAKGMANFSRLPYFDGEGDVNRHVTNVGESIISKPFQDGNFLAPSGFHLHWQLPIALRRGEQFVGQDPVFPTLPNRWLVVRWQHEKVQKSWVVESDYLWKQQKKVSKVAIPFPVNKVAIPFPVNIEAGQYQPFRYLGRQLTLEEWLTRDGTGEYWGENLTAIAYGEPSFTAFYPNCYSVFGCYDADIQDLKNAADLSYEIFGWYGDRQYDHFHICWQQLQSSPDYNHQTLEEKWQTLQETLNWKIKVNGKAKSAFNLTDTFNLCCYGRLGFADKLEKIQRPDNMPVDVVLANTGTEALSAYLATTAAQNTNLLATLNSTLDTFKKSLENYLEALQLSGTLAGSLLDLDARLQEARHEKGFAASSKDILWRIDVNHPAQQTEDSHEQTPEPILPEAIAVLLVRANELQEIYNVSLHQIESRKDQLFADWYKYLLCAYPPIGRITEYPQPDRVKRFIENQNMATLERLKQRAGTLHLGLNEAGRVVQVSANANNTQSESSSIATQLTDILNQLIAELNSFNQENIATGSRIFFELKQVPSPRYWQANEPVVMLVGNATQSTQNDAITNSSDNNLNCQIWQQNINFQDLTTETLESISRQIHFAIDQDLDQYGLNIYQQQPWTPFFLDWEIEVYPTNNLRGDNLSGQGYQAQFITGNYELKSTGIDLKNKPIDSFVKSDSLVRDIYSGRSFLSGHAQRQQETKIGDYLSHQAIIQEFAQAHNLKAPMMEILANHSQDLMNWIQESLSNSSPEDNLQISAQKRLLLPLLEAYRILLNTPCLSQCLGGLNTALLGRKQTLQLNIFEPLGFESYQNFTGAIAEAVARNTSSAPQPLNFFNSIRTGSLKIKRLRIVDTFGQIQDLTWTQTIIPSHLQMSYREEQWGAIHLPPRLVQGARLNARWLSGNPDYVGEASSHSLLNPICGWLLPDPLDGTLQVYDASGNALGELELKKVGIERWRSAPSSEQSITSVAEIANPYLRKVIQNLCETGETNTETDKFLADFVTAINQAWENIEPETTDRDPSLALLMGQPMAIARLSLNLQLQGFPAINQDWQAFRQDLRNNARNTSNLENVEFPIRLGDYRKLGDGLIGYWLESENQQLSEEIYIAQAQEIEHPKIITKPHQFFQTVEAQPQTVTVLLDPRAKVHLVTGILPTKDIQIPPEHYTQALKNISITFLTAPILTPTNIYLPLPDTQGYIWSWLEPNHDQTWSELSTIGIIEKNLFEQAIEQRNTGSTENPIIGSTVWDYLMQESIGWLRQQDQKNIVTPYEERPCPQLPEPYKSLQSQIELILDICSTKIRPPTVEANFKKQEIREGWLKLKTKKTSRDP